MNLNPAITSMPSWALFCLVVVICLLAVEAGVIIAHHRELKGIKEPSEPLGASAAAILGLLAFMLGFTFSFTAERFGERKELVIQQANAIGTCYLRTSLLPENQQRETQRIFREYINTLVQVQGKNNVEQSISHLEALHLLLWKQTASLVREDMDSEVRSLFIASVNQVIDLFGERNTVALVFRIPNVLWLSLLLLSALGMFVFGYEIGMLGQRRMFVMPFLAAAFASVIVLIADMDSMSGQRFKVSQAPLLAVQKMIQQDAP